MAVLDRQAQFRAVNPSFVATVGRTHDELRGRLVFDAFPDNPDDSTAGGSAVLAAFSGIGAPARPAARHGVAARRRAVSPPAVGR